MTRTLSRQHTLYIERNYAGLYLAAFLTVFFAGILFANLRWSDAIFWLGFQTENSLRQSDARSLSLSGFFVFFAKNRLLLWGIPAAAGFLRRKNLFLSVFSAWLGFSLGMFVTAVLRRFGFLSLPILAGIFFPQIIFYSIAYLIIGKNPHRRSRAYLPGAMISCTIWIVGALCEYAVNPQILEWLCGIALS